MEGKISLPIHFINKRKKAIASCRMLVSTEEGIKISVNKKPFYEYFSSIRSKAMRIIKLEEYCLEPKEFILKISGGGISSQLEAAITSISKALVSLDPKLKKLLKDQRLYKHDPRQHERNKPGLVKRRKDSPYRKR